MTSRSEMDESGDIGGGRPLGPAGGVGQALPALSFDLSQSEARAIVVSCLDVLDPDPVLRDTLRLVLSEVLNNIVEHAYDGALTGEVEIAQEPAEGRLRLRISDGGRAMPGGVLPRGGPVALNGPRDDLPEGGFGWYLIRQLSDRQCYERRAGRNYLWLDILSSGAKYRA
ncbi:ATP-binding protein [Aquicoccus sp. SCR17]|nr:ATP-binding protein [Carideicomes alvinocaridis]